MNHASENVTVVALRRLLIELKQYQPNTGVRIRRLGEMWLPGFMRIIVVDDKGVVLNDETASKLYSISDLSSLVQFEIDQRYQQYQPHFHYNIVLSEV
jgi:hypothetical protein